MLFLLKISILFYVVLIRAERDLASETQQPALHLQEEEPTTQASTSLCELLEEKGDISEISTENGSKRPNLNKNFQCGVRPHVRTRRIVGGKESTFGAWPWQVLVRELTPNCLATQFKYGGVLVSESYVLTVAHWEPEPNGSLVAIFGDYDISTDSEPKQPVTIKVKEIIYHPEFNSRTFDNDLAILKLQRPIQYDTHIVPICLPAHGADFTGRLATVSGWGRLRYDDGYPTVLQEVDVPIMENSKCQEIIHKLGYSKIILPSSMCAGYVEGGKDACEGDSGGPLVVQRPDKRWELAGTVSSGIKCAARFLPGIYMRISYHRLWIESIIGILKDDNEIYT